MKVIGMFLIIWGHLSPEYLKDCIYMFSVPSFFIISGFLFKTSDWRTFLYKNTTGLVVPYVLLTFSIVLFFAVVKLYFSNFSSNYFLYSIISCLIGDQDGMDGGVGCQAMWFVYTLFLVKVVANSVKSRWLLQLLIIAVFLFLAIFLNRNQISYFSSYINVFLAYPFFMLGYYVKYKYNKVILKLLNSINSFQKWIVYLFILFGLLVLFLVGSYNGMVQMYNADYGNSILLCLVGGVWGTFLLAIVGVLFNSKDYNRIIYCYSKGSVISLAWQIVFLFIIDQFSTKAGFTCIHNDFITFLLAVFIFIAFVPIIKFINKNIPILVGYRK